MKSLVGKNLGDDQPKTATVRNKTTRIRINWFIIGSVNVLMGMTFFMETPLLHQYVTATNNQTEPMSEPGLDLSEDWYSVIISAGNAGGFIGAITYGLLSRYIYVRLGLTVELMVELIGGLLFAFTSNGWCLLTSRLLNGFFIGFHQSLMRNYAVESSEKCLSLLTPEKRSRSTLKYTVLFLLFCCVVSGMALGPAVPVLGGYLPHMLSRFHWPGWYMSIHSILLLVLVVFVFSDNWEDISRSLSNESIPDSTHYQVAATGNNASAPLSLCKTTIGGVPFYILLMFIYIHLVLGWNMSILETLQNPILSDQFGFDMEKTSFILIGILGVYLVSLIILFIVQKFRVDNRVILVAACLVGIVGTIIMMDWQAIGSKLDPCFEHNLTSELIQASAITNDNIADCALANSTVDCLLDREMLSQSQTECLTNSTSSHCLCEVFGDITGNRCFWNQKGRITGNYCTSCRGVCLNEDLSLNFAQIIIGTVLLSFSYAPGRILVITILSDMVGNRPQGWMMGIMMASGAIARATGPFWGNYMYVYTDRRTWLPMLAMLVMELIAVLMVIIFYQKMKKKQQKIADDDNKDLKMDSASVSSLQVDNNESGQLLLLMDGDSLNDKQLIATSAIV